jgi:two-component system cell cycle sensor histidine kinase/response regulator CckA
LRKDGHEVVETADGRDTIQQFREAREAARPFDLVLSDFTIEDGRGGVETIQALRRLDPDVVAIVSSGYSDAPAMARPSDFGFTAVLPKPYPPKDLRRIVSQVLSRRIRHRRPEF